MVQLSTNSQSKWRGKQDKPMLGVRPDPCGQGRGGGGKLVQRREEGTVRMGFDG